MFLTFRFWDDICSSILSVISHLLQTQDNDVDLIAM